ncbi:MAG: Mucin-2 [Microgenomates group bacterium GW2011_GWC1_37_8]|uniref:Mucin-2 n=1 Tax=Candidatus Woesebacteria bacterium GW2011_GWB1_38_8 TaxID=1618570 RepID=A0A0G0P6G4_9BACT|nr:MAG: Mucin-2 [Microgenomates group bacterium GW2011_GWC1_37_8]KKQ84911.1 MAG: Mucin-2 [Candidatus Woesebacteria bacterium GW2011_GWB1_38_8]
MENDNQQVNQTSTPEVKTKSNKALWITIGLVLLLVAIGAITYFSLSAASKNVRPTPTPPTQVPEITEVVPTEEPTPTSSSISATPKVSLTPTAKITTKPSLTPTSTPKPTTPPIQY